MKKTILIALLAAIVLAGSVSAAACGGVTVCNCGDDITSDYTFAADLVCTGIGLAVLTDGITVDGAGFTLSRTGGLSDTALNIIGVGVTVKNLKVEGFNNGISIGGGSSGTFIDMILDDNSVGIDSIFQSGSTFTDTRACNNADTDIRIIFGSHTFTGFVQCDTDSACTDVQTVDCDAPYPGGEPEEPAPIPEFSVVGIILTLIVVGIGSVFIIKRKK